MCDNLGDYFEQEITRLVVEHGLTRDEAIENLVGSIIKDSDEIIEIMD